MERAKKRRIGLGGWLAGGVLIVIGSVTPYWGLFVLGALVGSAFGVVWWLNLDHGDL